MGLIYDPDKDIFTQQSNSASSVVDNVSNRGDWGGPQQISGGAKQPSPKQPDSGGSLIESTYNAPNLVEPNAQVGQTKGAESYIDPSKATVEGRIEGIVDKGGPLMQMERANARKEGARSGLINSTMTGTAGERAVLERAESIAKPDAATYARFGENNQLTDNQGKLNVQNAQLDTVKQANNAFLTAALADQTSKLSEGLKKLDFDFNKVLKGMDIEAAERIALANSMSSQTNTLISAITSLLNNGEIEVTDETLDWLTPYMYSNMQSTASLMNLDIKVT